MSMSAASHDSNTVQNRGGNLFTLRENTMGSSSTAITRQEREGDGAVKPLRPADGPTLPDAGPTSEVSVLDLRLSLEPGNAVSHSTADGCDGERTSGHRCAMILCRTPPLSVRLLAFSLVLMSIAGAGVGTAVAQHGAYGNGDQTGARCSYTQAKPRRRGDYASLVREWGRYSNSTGPCEFVSDGNIYQVPGSVCRIDNTDPDCIERWEENVCTTELSSVCTGGDTPHDWANVPCTTLVDSVSVRSTNLHGGCVGEQPFFSLDLTTNLTYDTTKALYRATLYYSGSGGIIYELVTDDPMPGSLARYADFDEIGEFDLYVIGYITCNPETEYDVCADRELTTKLLIQREDSKDPCSLTELREEIKNGASIVDVLDEYCPAGRRLAPETECCGHGGAGVGFYRDSCSVSRYAIFDLNWWISTYYRATGYGVMCHYHNVKDVRETASLANTCAGAATGSNVNSWWARPVYRAGTQTGNFRHLGKEYRMDWCSSQDTNAQASFGMAAAVSSSVRVFGYDATGARPVVRSSSSNVDVSGDGVDVWVNKLISNGIVRFNVRPQNTASVLTDWRSRNICDCDWQTESCSSGSG